MHGFRTNDLSKDLRTWSVKDTSASSVDTCGASTEQGFLVPHLISLSEQLLSNRLHSPFLIYSPILSAFSISSSFARFLFSVHNESHR